MADSIWDSIVEGAKKAGKAVTEILQDGLKDMWTVMAGRLAAHPGVVGFEVLNEPGWGTALDLTEWKVDVLTPFHTALAAQLRGIAPDVLLQHGAVAQRVPRQHAEGERERRRDDLAQAAAAHADHRDPAAAGVAHRGVDDGGGDREFVHHAP